MSPPTMQIEDWILPKNPTNRPPQIGTLRTTRGWAVYHVDGSVRVRIGEVIEAGDRFDLPGIGSYRLLDEAVRCVVKRYCEGLMMDPAVAPAPVER